jgi:hypothetical protein
MYAALKTAVAAIAPFDVERGKPPASVTTQENIWGVRPLLGLCTPAIPAGVRV